MRSLRCHTSRSSRPSPFFRWYCHFVMPEPPVEVTLDWIVTNPLTLAINVGFDGFDGTAAATPGVAHARQASTTSWVRHRLSSASLNPCRVERR